MKKKKTDYVEFKVSVPNRRLLFSAKSFHDAAQVIENSNTNDVPRIVCLAFSIELYLKSLNSKTLCAPEHIEEKEHGVKHYKKLIDKPNKTGHDLKILFDTIPNPYQDGISECWEELGFNHEHGSLIELVEEYKDLFKHWRYSFEGDIRPVNLTALTAIAKCFHSYTEKIAER